MIENQSLRGSRDRSILRFVVALLASTIIIPSASTIIRFAARRVAIALIPGSVTRTKRRNRVSRARRHCAEVAIDALRITRPRRGWLAMGIAERGVRVAAGHEGLICLSSAPRRRRGAAVSNEERGRTGPIDPSRAILPSEFHVRPITADVSARVSSDILCPAPTGNFPCRDQRARHARRSVSRAKDIQSLSRVVSEDRYARSNSARELFSFSRRSNTIQLCVLFTLSIART